MGYIADTTIAGFRGTYNLGLFFRLDTPTPLRLWLGVSDTTAEIANIDAGGVTYQGAGFISDVPDGLDVLINGASDRADWTLNNIPAPLLTDFATQMPSVVGCRVDFGIAALDERWQLQGPVISAWVGTADFWTDTQGAQPDVTKPKLRSLTLSTMTGDTTRALPYYATWTDLDQRAISPTDSFCQRVPRYYTGLAVAWPRF